MKDKLYTYYIIYICCDRANYTGMLAAEFNCDNDDDFWEQFSQFRRSGNYNNSNPHDIRLVSLRVV